MAFGYRSGSDEDFAAALEALPLSESEIRDAIRAKFGVHVEKKPAPMPIADTPGESIDMEAWATYSDYLWIRYKLEEAVGEGRAADAISELVVTQGGPRVLEAVRRNAQGEEVYVRADDPELVHLLFDGDGWETELGEYVDDYWRRSRPPDPGQRLEEDHGEVKESLDEEMEDEGAEGIADVRLLKDALRVLRNAPARKSADPMTGLAFRRVQAPAERYLTIDTDWKEADLEAFLLQHWEEIDWGFASPLYLVGTQVQLDPESRDRVDILAQGGNGQPVAIELKIGEARPRDVSQLAAYMTHLDRTGKGRAHGLLVAAKFPLRVKNAAVQNRRIRLLEFRVPSA